MILVWKVSQLQDLIDQGYPEQLIEPFYEILEQINQYFGENRDPINDDGGFIAVIENPSDFQDERISKIIEVEKKGEGYSFVNPPEVCIKNIFGNKVFYELVFLRDNDTGYNIVIPEEKWIPEDMWEAIKEIIDNPDGPTTVVNNVYSVGE